jgi:hypothetical protein
MRKLTCVLAVAALSACNCGGSNNKNDPVTVDNVCERLYTGYCDWAVRCAPLQLHSDRAGCIKAFTDQCNKQINPVLKAGVPAGRISFDSGKADACISSVTGMACNVLPTTGDACKDVIVPKVAGGGNCFDDMECIDGTCLLASGCPGKCEIRGKVGDTCGNTGDPPCDSKAAKCDYTAHKCVALATSGACSYSSDCADGYFCKKPSTSGSCKPFGTLDCTCSALGGAGAACTTSSECQQSLSCVSSVCKAPAKSGEACNFQDGGCEAKLACLISDVVTGAGVCGDPRGSGGDCYVIYECANNLTCRNADLTTNPPGKGKCDGYAKEGDSCKALPGTFYAGGDCGIGLSCQGGTCQKRPGAGSNCSRSPDMCFGNEALCVPSTPNGQTGVCGPKPGAGENCAGYTCADGNSCDSTSYKCVAKKPLGGTCNYDSDCVTNVCGSNKQCSAECKPS